MEIIKYVKTELISCLLKKILLVIIDLRGMLTSAKHRNTLKLYI